MEGPQLSTKEEKEVREDEGTSKKDQETDQKQETSKPEVKQDSSSYKKSKEHVLCLTGLHRYTIEKDIHALLLK